MLRISDEQIKELWNSNWRKDDTTSLYAALWAAQISHLAQMTDDQRLPENVGFCMCCTDSFKMLNANFRKIIPKGE